MGTMSSCTLLLGFILFFIDKSQQQQICGIANRKPGARLDTKPVLLPYIVDFPSRIVGGVEARPNSWPWMAAVIRGNNFICGGALIHERFVLTAAHCIDPNPQASRYRVVLGAHNWYYGYVYNVSRVAVHPNYNQGYNLNNDVALFRLSQRAYVESPAVGTVCMPTGYLSGGRMCTATGWGTTSEGGSISAALREVQVPILNNTVCNRADFYGGRISPAMLCAGWERGGKDTCQGDSGGPLVCQVSGRWQVYGVVSWGEGCARPRRPGVYARVSVLQSWIINQMAQMGN